MAGSVNSYLADLLQIHWLRPETALWRCFDCMLMERHRDLHGPSVDLGCGDGTLSYVMAGGRIHDYDVFRDVAEPSGYGHGVDIHNVAPQTLLELDDSGLRYFFSMGVDHKQGLIEKARRFKNFYCDTLVHDLNKPLPLPSESFASAFSNVLYWLDDIDSALQDWNRILKPAGRLFLFVPNHNFKQKAWLYYAAPHGGERRYFNYFDRGYNALIRHCYDHKRWTTLFKKHRFAVLHHHTYLTDPVMEIWNLGTRPLAPLLIDMANRLSSEGREAVKRKWIDFFIAFMSPIIEGEMGRVVSNDKCAFHFYVLEKN